MSAAKYRSAIIVTARSAAADATRTISGGTGKRGCGAITTEIRGGQPGDETPIFYYAEEYHQRYLAKIRGYCGLAGTGASCALPTGVQALVCDCGEATSPDRRPDCRSNFCLERPAALGLAGHKQDVDCGVFRRRAWYSWAL